jgi:hypothetical protein
VTIETKQQLAALLQLGCGRETAAAFCGVDSCEVEREIESDSDLLREIRRSEARFEVAHLRKLQKAAEGEKNWRISVWWLERRWPERYARKAHAITIQQLEQFTDNLAEVLTDDLDDDHCREQIARRLKSLLDGVEYEANRPDDK